VLISGKIKGTIGRTNFDDDFLDISIDVALSLPSSKRDVSQQLSSCDIVNLNLGPITLDVLGIVLQTNKIVVDLTVLTCVNNLVGSLLCALGNILNGTTTYATPGVSDLVVAINLILGQIPPTNYGS